MFINTNISALKAHAASQRNAEAQAKAMERLSTGLRINSAADDAAGAAVAQLMSKQIGGMKTAIRNISDGISLVQTAESAMSSIGNIVLRMRDLAIQASNGTYSTTDVLNLQTEFANLISEIDHIADKTDFNGIALLDGSAIGGMVTLQISDDAGDLFGITLYDLNAAVLGTSAGDPALVLADISTAAGASTALDSLDDAIENIATYRANMGAAQNRLTYTGDNLTANTTNISAARSRVQDTDMAAEMAELSKQKVLTQTALNMLGQANQATQPILQLLQQA